MRAGLDGRVALVTGSARGIGAATASALRAAGATVVGLDKEGGPSTLKLDLADTSALAAAVPSVVAEHGRLDILVNNAGLARHGAVPSIDAAELDAMWSVNVRAAILLARDAMRVMRPGSDIVNVVSTAGLRGEPGEAAYCATKFALRGFTEAAAEEGRVSGIRVQGIYPAGVDTGFWDEAVGDRCGFTAGKQFLDPVDVAARIIAMITARPDVELTTVVVRHRGDADLDAIRAKLARVGRRP
jgi:NAD(P)-dependent dehydrogenase (short-subunit alcohol dehydrogenase family)